MVSALTVSEIEFEGLIGVGREDITPPVGIYARNWGAATHFTAEGVHRPLTATAITLQTENGSAPLALVVLDLGWWRSRRDEWALRGRLLERLGWDSSHLMVHFTHTHAGPVLCREDADKPGGHLIGPYMERLASVTEQAIRQAMTTATASTLSWTTGRCDLAQNRDLRLPDNDRILCGYNPTGAADDTLVVGRVTAHDGRTMATLVNYACHPVTLAWQNRQISPDFVGAMREVVENQTASPCLFLQGASGELAPREQYTDDVRVADRHGRKLGYAALSALEGLLPPRQRLAFTGVVESGAPLGRWELAPDSVSTCLEAKQISVEMPLKPMPTVAEFDSQILACTDPVIKERLLRMRRIRDGVGDGEGVGMPAWIWKLGDAVMIGHPNEAYSLLQTELRNRFPDRVILVMNVTNGHFGYLPPHDCYDLDIYPVWQTPFDGGSLEQCIAACDEAIRL